ncbi:MAG: SsrA-binding protein SmpB [Clostridia bacterium]
MKKEKTDRHIISTNKKAYHDYFVEDTLETGIQLIGCEVKSLRLGDTNLKDSYAVISNGTLILKSCYIKVYDKGSFSNVESRRDRRLLAHKSEIRRWLQKVKEKGYSIVPLSLYFVGSLVKVEIALAKGKQLYDKREALAKKDMERANAREDY